MIEKTADDSDLASQREAQNNEQALIRRRAEEEKRIAATKTALEHGNFDGVHCIDAECGAPLPASRIIDHRMLCTSCQAIREKQNKLKGFR